MLLLRLCSGTLEGFCVTCPWHNYTFDLRDGSCRTDPKFQAKTYEIIRDAESFKVKE